MSLAIQQVVNGLALGSTYALVALGLALVFGVLLVPNFAHGELYMLGGVITYGLTSTGLNFWLALIVATPLVGLMGIALDRGVFRPLQRSSGLSMMIAAFAASIILQQLVTLVWGTDSRTIAAPVSGIFRTRFFIVTRYHVVLFVALAVVWTALWLLLNRSRLGLAIRAVAQNRPAAELMGIDLGRIRTITFFASAAIGGLAGALLGASSPIYPSVGFTPMLKAFIVLVVGGIGNLWGAIVGAFALGVVEVMVAGYISSELQDIGAFAVLVLVLLLKPNGMLGSAEVER
jgi:branched-chain amino acid transport system permease protein